MLNELLTTNFQHGRRAARPLPFRVSLREQGPGRLLLDYRDNGPGLSPTAPRQASGGQGTHLLRTYEPATPWDGGIRYGPGCLDPDHFWG